MGVGADRRGFRYPLGARDLSRGSERQKKACGGVKRGRDTSPRTMRR